MGRGRRQQRLQQRRRDRSAVAERSAAEPGTPRRQKPAWRQSLDQWGGLPVLAAVMIAVVLIGVLVWQNRPAATLSPSDEPLMGQEVPMTSAAHINDADLMDIQPGLPPAGGPHFPQWLPTGIYDEPQQDGLIVHSLEHGVIWFSYNPDLLSDEDLEVVERVGREFSNDVIVAPRPDNAGALYALSWGRRLEVETPVDADVLRQFVRTNVNRAPEPGVR